MDSTGVQIVTEADTKKGGPMRTDMSDTKTCDKCGTEYEPRVVLIKDDFNSIVAWKKRKLEYENLCEDCDDEWHEENA